MKQLRLLLGITTIAFSSTLSADCIQAPTRTQACPHQIYRLGQLDGMPKPAILCICVTDFQEFLKQPEDKDEALEQSMKRLKLEQELGQKIAPILKVLRS